MIPDKSLRLDDASQEPYVIPDKPMRWDEASLEFHYSNCLFSKNSLTLYARTLRGYMSMCNRLLVIGLIC